MNNLKNYLKKTIPIIKKEIYDSNKKTLKIDDLDDFQRFQIMNIYSKILQKIGEDKELVEKLKNSNFFKQIECLFNTKDINNLKQILTEYLTTNKREIITNFFENVCEMQVNKNKLGGYKNKTCKNKCHRKSKKSKKNKRKLSKKNKLFFGGAYPDGFLTGQFNRCEICFDDFDDQNNYVVLHANENNQDRRHNYHRNCLTSWTNTNVRSCDENRNIILTSPYFENYNNYGLDKKLKNILDNSNYSIKEYWFENNPKACIENVSKRQSHKIGSTALIPEIWYYSKNYKIPTDAETISVWQGE